MEKISPLHQGMRPIWPMPRLHWLDIKHARRYQRKTKSDGADKDFVWCHFSTFVKEKILHFSPPVTCVRFFVSSRLLLHLLPPPPPPPPPPRDIFTDIKPTKWHKVLSKQSLLSDPNTSWKSAFRTSARLDFLGPHHLRSCHQAWRWRARRTYVGKPLEPGERWQLYKNVYIYIYICWFSLLVDDVHRTINLFFLLK